MHPSLLIKGKNWTGTTNSMEKQWCYRYLFPDSDNFKRKNTFISVREKSFNKLIETVLTISHNSIKHFLLEFG